MGRLRAIIIALGSLWLLSCGVASPGETKSLLSDQDSQSRAPDETFAEAEARYKAGLTDVNRSAFINLHSVRSSAVPYAALDTTGVEEWDSLTDVISAYEQGRDHQFISDPSRQLLRRSTWLFPDNGCYTRGDLMARNIRSFGFPDTSKIYVFGPLAVSTSNHVSGQVFWWYHTAPTVQVAGQVYVLDPAVNPAAPLTLTSWLGMITSSLGELEISLCSRYAYGPYSRCVTPTDQGPSRALASQETFLDDEWERLESLGRDPAAELGDSPPWL